MLSDGHDPFSASRSRRSQYNRAGKDHLVLAELVVDPLPNREVHRAVDFGSDRSTIRQAPFRVEITAPAVCVGAHSLSRWRRQPIPLAQATEIDLAQRMRALIDVVDRQCEHGSMPDPWRSVERGAEVDRAGQPLLNRRRDDPATRARGVEARGGDEYRGRNAVQPPPQSHIGTRPTVDEHGAFALFAGHWSVVQDDGRPDTAPSVR